MKNLALLALPALCLLALPAAHCQPATPLPQPIAAEYGNLPLSFEANQGQAAADAKFLARGPGYSVFLTDAAAVFSLTKAGPDTRHQQASATNTDTLRLELSGASAATHLAAGNPLPGTASYFTSSDPSQWHTSVPTYAQVKYTGVYPGIDLIYYGNQQQLEYDFILAPGANPGHVQLHFAGASQLQLDAHGDLQVTANHGTIAFHRPSVYQQKNGQRQPVQGSFKLLAGNRIGFALGRYDHARELIIDPVLAYSTYLGGNSFAGGYGIAVDSAGSAYVTGFASGSGFQTTSGAFQQTAGSSFVSKLNPSGTALVYSCYFGGEYDTANAITVDSSGNAYLTGAAQSSSFPITANAYQKTNKAASLDVSNVFITKINPAGSALVYSTFLGGSGDAYAYDDQEGDVYDYGDQGTSIALDSSGNAYVTGLAYSTNFPVTASAFQKTKKDPSGDATVFVTKLNAAGSALAYSTYLGGANLSASEPGVSGRKTLSRKRLGPLTVGGGDLYPNPLFGGDNGYGIAVSNAGEAYVTGFAETQDFPTTRGAYQTYFHPDSYGSTGFVTRLNTSGSALIYSTFLGGSASDGATAIAIDSSGDAYVTGQSSSTDFPVTSNAFQKTNPGQVAFVTKFNPTGTALLYSTFLGGSSYTDASGDVSNGIVIDSAGDAYITGYTVSSNFPLTTDALSKTFVMPFSEIGAFTVNAFLAKFNPSGSVLDYSTLFGPSEFEVGATSIAIDSSGNIYTTGMAPPQLYPSFNFPVTSGALQKVGGNPSTGFTDAFISKFAFSAAGSPVELAVSSSPNPQKARTALTFTIQATPLSGTAIPTGTVALSFNGSAISTVDLDSGTATYTTSSLAAALYTVVATYSGDSTYAPTSATFSQFVSGTASVVQPFNYGYAAVYGSQFETPITALITDANNIPIPGTVVHFSGADIHFSSAAVTTGANGEASTTITAAGVGNLRTTVTVTNAKTPGYIFAIGTPAPLTVTAKNITVAQGQPIPKLTYTTTGFVHGDNSSVVTGAPGETTTATETSAPGTYPITLTQGTLSATNYTFTLVNGTVTITAAK